MHRDDQYHVMEDLKQMQVSIGGRTYPLRVKPEDEEAIRQLVKELSVKINDFQLTYLNKDIQDCLAMTLLTYAVDHHKLLHGAHSAEHMSAKIERLHALVDDVLK